MTTLYLSDADQADLDALSHETNLPAPSVLRHALRLYKLAHERTRAGERLGLVAVDGTFSELPSDWH